MAPSAPAHKAKLSAVSGVYIPVVLNIISILMFLRFGSILGRIGLVGILGLLVVAYFVDTITTLSLSAIASNGEVKGGGAYYLISRSLGPEFGGSIGVLFYLSQVMNTSLNIVGLIDCLKLNLTTLVPHGFWNSYAMETCALVVCTALCLAGSAMFARASNGLLVVLIVATLSIPVSMFTMGPFHDPDSGVVFTGASLSTLRANLFPYTSNPAYSGMDTFRELFGVLFPATSGIFAGASMSGDLRNPSKAIPKGTLWALLSTFILYLLVITSMASSITHGSFTRQTNIIYETSIWSPLVLAGECATTFFSALMGIVGAAKLLQALARDKLLPGFSIFGQGTKRGDDPIFAVLLTYAIAQLALFADLNQIATLISMGYQMTFFVMNLACFLLKIGSAPNFRPAFHFFSWQTAFLGSALSAAAMFFIDETYAVSAITLLVLLFLLIHYASPPKHWGDVSQNLIYHQVRKYLLRLKPEHIKFWRPQIILLINDPRHHTRLIQFCNSMKKGSLYMYVATFPFITDAFTPSDPQKQSILGHVIVTDDFTTGIDEAKHQQSAWGNYISEYSRIKAFVQLTMSPTIVWGVRNLILSAGLGGMRPNIAMLGFYNMDELRSSLPPGRVLNIPAIFSRPQVSQKVEAKAATRTTRRRGDTSARLLEQTLPTDTIRREAMMSPTSYLTILEDLALRHRLNVAVGKGFQSLETPRPDKSNNKKYIDLWPIQMSAEITEGGRSVLTSNFDTYTLILQLGYVLFSVPAWKKAFQLRVLVFVEYESEIEDERRRLKALLEKLRIEAEIVALALASGQLRTYEYIVNGDTSHPDTTNITNELLHDDEWWMELQHLRNEASELSRSQELASLGIILGDTKRRNSDPQFEADGPSRRFSVTDLMELPRNPTVSQVSKLGFNFGIHTHRLSPVALDEAQPNGSNYSSDDDSASTTSLDADFNDINDVASGHSTEDSNPSLRRRLSTFMHRKKSLREIITGRSDASDIAPLLRQSTEPVTGTTSGYGSIASETTVPIIRKPLPHTLSADSPRRTVNSGKNKPPLSTLEELGESAGHGKLEAPAAPAPPPTRPPLSRNSSASRFTSNLTPDTKITVEEGAGPKISFATEQTGSSSGACAGIGAATPKSPRPTISRSSSAMRFSSLPVPETKVEEGEGGAGPRLTFAERAPADYVSPATPHRSRQNSTTRAGASASSDAHVLDIPEMLESYRFGAAAARASSMSEETRGRRRGEESETSGLAGAGERGERGAAAAEDEEQEEAEQEREEEEEEEADAGSSAQSYATQSLPLSFNDLPSRAQHLILNELMRRHSGGGEGGGAAVLLTTLPIPVEDTCRSEDDSLRYLSDVEVLCHDLPPVLLVLSNNMTVTVSL